MTLFSGICVKTERKNLYEYVVVAAVCPLYPKRKELYEFVRLGALESYGLTKNVVY